MRRDTDGTLLLRAADMPSLRLKTPARGAVMVNGERYYRMGPENGAVAVFDEATQTVQLTLPAQGVHDDASGIPGRGCAAGRSRRPALS